MLTSYWIIRKVNKYVGTYVCTYLGKYLPNYIHMYQTRNLEGFK